MRIALAGSGQLAVSMLQPLLDSEHAVVAVLQDGRRTKGLQRTLAPLSDGLLMSAGGLSFLAARHGLPILWLDKMTEEELAPLRKLEPDLLLVGGFGIILKKPLLELPRVGCVNMHSSLLPRHRGPNPFCAVVLQGERESGVTFHVMDEGIDTGDIVDQSAFPLSPADTPYAVYEKACTLAADRVVDVMDKIAATGLHGLPQDPALASYDKKPTALDAHIRWQDTAVEIERRVRALASLQTTYFLHEGAKVYVTRAACSEAPGGAAPGTVVSNRPQVTVATGAGRLHILSAHTGGPVTIPWPPPWKRPAPGEVLGAAAAKE